MNNHEIEHELLSIMHDDSILSCMNERQQDAVLHALSKLQDEMNEQFKEKVVVDLKTLHEPKYMIEDLPHHLDNEGRIVKCSRNSDKVSTFWVLEQIHYIERKLITLKDVKRGLEQFIISKTEVKE